MINNNFFGGLWRKFFGGIYSAPLGIQRPLSMATVLSDETLLGRNHDLEIYEIPIRDSLHAKQLIEISEYCPELHLAGGEISDAIWSSADGDDQGFKIGEHLDEDNTIAIDAEVKLILDRLMEEVIGGIKLEPASLRLIKYGDSFGSIGINIALRQIDSLLFLPTWEMFRVENNHGELLRFEQRRYLGDGSPIEFHPMRVVHWRYKRNFLYGEPLWGKGTLDEWDKLKQATDDLARASRELGINPNIHEMPAGSSKQYQAAYITAYEAKKRAGIVTDFYIANSGDLRKVAAFNPDLKGLIDNVLLRRKRVAMSTRLPAWCFGLDDGAAKDIAGQPALSYARTINRFRQSISEGIKQICDLELALKGIPKDRWKYRIEFPKIETNPYQQQATSVNNSMSSNNSTSSNNSNPDGN